MVVALFQEKIVIFLDHYPLRMNYTGFSNFLHAFVVHFRTFINETQFSQVA